MYYACSRTQVRIVAQILASAPMRGMEVYQLSCLFPKLCKTDTRQTNRPTDEMKLHVKHGSYTSLDYVVTHSEKYFHPIINTFFCTLKIICNCRKKVFMLAIFHKSLTLMGEQPRAHPPNPSLQAIPSPPFTTLNPVNQTFKHEGESCEQCAVLACQILQEFCMVFGRARKKTERLLFRKRKYSKIWKNLGRIPSSRCSLIIKKKSHALREGEGSTLSISST